MAEEIKGSDEQEPVADAPAKETKTYSAEEFKKAIDERDKAKEKARKYEDAQKAADEKLIEDGKLKELLTSRETELAEARKKVEAYELQQTKLRESLIEKLPEEDRELATDIHDIDKLQKLVEKLTEQKIDPYSANGKKKPVSTPDDKPVKDLQGALDKYRAQGLI